MSEEVKQYRTYLEAEGHVMFMLEDERRNPTEERVAYQIVPYGRSAFAILAVLDYSTHFVTDDGCLL